MFPAKFDQIIMLICKFKLIEYSMHVYNTINVWDLKYVAKYNVTWMSAKVHNTIFNEISATFAKSTSFMNPRLEKIPL